jgi:predicted N-acyltransferase
MRIRVTSSWEELPPGDWHRLARNRSAFQQEAWYRSAPAAGTLRLIVGEESGRPVAALPLYRLDQPGHYYSSPSEILTGAGEAEMLRDRKVDAAPLYAARRLRWYPAMSSMSPYGYRGGVLGTPALDAHGLRHFLKSVLDLCADEGARVVSFHYLVEHEDTPLMDALIEMGGAPAVLGASCRLALRWTTTEEYFAWLGASRRSVRSDYRRSDRAPGTEWTAINPSDLKPDNTALIAALFEETLRRHGDTDPPTALLRRSAQGAAGESVLFLAHDHSGVRSAMTSLRHHDTLYPKFFGTNAGRGHYFPLCYWHSLQYALREGLAAIDFGGGATRAKLWRGASLYWDLGIFFFLDRDLSPAAEPMTRIMSAANHSYFTELARHWGLDHEAPPLPYSFRHLTRCHG